MQNAPNHFRSVAAKSQEAESFESDSADDY